MKKIVRAVSLAAVAGILLTGCSSFDDLVKPKMPIADPLVSAVSLTGEDGKQHATLTLNSIERKEVCTTNGKEKKSKNGEFLILDLKVAVPADGKSLDTDLDKFSTVDEYGLSIGEAVKDTCVGGEKLVLPKKVAPGEEIKGKIVIDSKAGLEKAQFNIDGVGRYSFGLNGANS